MQVTIFSKIKIKISNPTMQVTIFSKIKISNPTMQFTIFSKIKIKIYASHYPTMQVTLWHFPNKNSKDSFHIMWIQN